MEQETANKAEPSLEEQLNSAREANRILMECLRAVNDALVARDKYIEFLTASGRFTISDVHVSDSLANDITARTNRAYSLAPIKELIPSRYQHLFGTHWDPMPSSQKQQQQVRPNQQPIPEPLKTPEVPPQDVKADAFTTPEITVKLKYDNSATAAEFSRSTTAAVLSWYNTYLTTLVNKIHKDNMKTCVSEVGITNELLMRDGFVDNFKQYSRNFSTQMNVKIRLILPDGTSSLIVPIVGLN